MRFSNEEDIKAKLFKTFKITPREIIYAKTNH